MMVFIQHGNFNGVPFSLKGCNGTLGSIALLIFDYNAVVISCPRYKQRWVKRDSIIGRKAGDWRTVTQLIGCWAIANIGLYRYVAVGDNTGLRELYLAGAGGDSRFSRSCWCWC